MKITFEWKITSIRTVENVDIQNFVVRVEWKKTGTDELGNKGYNSGAIDFEKSVDDLGNFIPFEELTEEIVLKWVQNDMLKNNGTTEFINLPIIDQIIEFRNPSIEKRLPWLK